MSGKAGTGGADTAPTHSQSGAGMRRVFSSMLWPLHPRERDPVPFYRSLSGPQGRSGWVRKTSPPPGFDLRTIQPVASRYTDYAIPAA